MTVDVVSEPTARLSAGKPDPSTWTLVPTLPEAGVIVSTRGAMLRTTEPLRPCVSVMLNSCSPGVVVVLVTGMTKEDDQLPALSTSIGSPSFKLLAPRFTELAPSFVSSPLMVASASPLLTLIAAPPPVEKPLPTKVTVWFGTKFSPGVTVNCAPDMTMLKRAPPVLTMLCVLIPSSGL